MCEKCNEIKIEDLPQGLPLDLQEEDDYDFTVKPIIFNKENLIEVEFDEDKFQHGLDNISFVCGQVTGLINVGIHPIDALNYLTNLDVLKNNLEISKINKETSLGVAKETAIQVEKNSI